MREKIKIWTKRYFPAEIVSSSVAILTALLLNFFGAGDIVLSLIAAWAEIISFYLYFIFVEIYFHKNLHFLKIARSLILEFGPAEILDALLRPVFIYCGTLIFSNLALGVLFGKILADLIFYTIAIIFFEIKNELLDHKK